LAKNYNDTFFAGLVAVVADPVAETGVEAVVVVDEVYRTLRNGIT